MILNLGEGDLALLIAIAGPNPEEQAKWLLKQIRKALNRQPDSTLLKEFENDFWPNYPRRKDRGHAVTAYIRARSKADAGTILRGLAAYSLSVRGREERFICLPATWLNGERWTDEYKPEAAPNAAGMVDPHLALRRNLDHLLKTNRWISREPDPRQHWPSWWPAEIKAEYQPKFAAKGITL